MPVRRLDIGRLIGHLNCTSTAGRGLINIGQWSDIVGAISSAGIDPRTGAVRVGEAVSQVDQDTRVDDGLRATRVSLYGRSFGF